MLFLLIEWVEPKIIEPSSSFDSQARTFNLFISSLKLGSSFEFIYFEPEKKARA